MKFKSACFVAFLAIAGMAVAQPVDQKPKSTAELVADVTALVSKHFPTKAELRAGADRLARTYQTQLKQVPKQVHQVVADAETRLNDLRWQQKLNLAMELWRVRSSLDLMTLVSPEVLEELTGLSVRDFRRLSSTFSRAEAQIENILPSWATPKK